MEKQHCPRISNRKPEMKYGIPFSQGEMCLVICALKEFRKFHLHPAAEPQLTPMGLESLSKLINSLEVAYTFFKRAE